MFSARGSHTDQLSDMAAFERLKKDVRAVKNDIADLTDRITGALNAFAEKTSKQARNRYQQARSDADSALDDFSERSGAMMEAAQKAASSMEETLEDTISQRPLATLGLALGLGVLIGMTLRR